MLLGNFDGEDGVLWWIVFDVNCVVVVGDDVMYDGEVEVGVVFFG